MEFWSFSDVSKEDMPDKSCLAIRKAVEEVSCYLKDWKASGHDAFWHQKSHQVVLAVVVCEGVDGTLLSYRGMNTEVSLPAGSLCAERAAIARAASEMRAAHEIVSVAVLDPLDKHNPLWPCKVCQSWLAKMRDQSAAIFVIAMKDVSCQSFVVRVNGVNQGRPRLVLPPPAAISALVKLAEGTEEQPWEATELVYVDGAWDGLGPEQLALLKAAKGKGTHLLAGLHSDETLQQQGVALHEPFATRLERLLDERHVSSVLMDAPWTLSEDLIDALGIRRVITESKTVERRNRWCKGAYEAARKREIFEVVVV